MNPHANPSTTPISLIKSVITHRNLIITLTNKEITSRYKGSFLGTTWAILTPIIMVSVFTFVFGSIFNSKWPGTENPGGINYAAALFSGLLLFSFFSEIVSRAPGLILENASYVKKVVFPLDILSVVHTLAATVQLLIAYGTLLFIIMLSDWSISWSALWVPAIVLPLIAFSLGVSWIISALGVYIRDISQIIAPALTATMFLSPIFYELSTVKPSVQWLYKLNPLTYAIQSSRAALLHNTPPQMMNLALYAVICTVFAFVGYAIFQKTKRGFSDVI